MYCVLVWIGFVANIGIGFGFWEKAELCLDRVNVVGLIVFESG